MIGCGRIGGLPSRTPFGEKTLYGPTIVLQATGRRRRCAPRPRKRLRRRSVPDRSHLWWLQPPPFASLLGGASGRVCKGTTGDRHDLPQRIQYRGLQPKRRGHRRNPAARAASSVIAPCCTAARTWPSLRCLHIPWRAVTHAAIWAICFSAVADASALRRLWSSTCRRHFPSRSQLSKKLTFDRVKPALSAA